MANMKSPGPSTVLVLVLAGVWSGVSAVFQLG